MSLALLTLACTDPGEDPAADTPGDTAPVEEAVRCHAVASESGETVDTYGFVYAVGESVDPAEGVQVYPCDQPEQAVSSDAEGTWVLPLPDTTWVTVEQHLEPYIPVRGVYDLTHEGRATGHPYRTGLAGDDTRAQVLADLGVEMDPELAIIDVCVSDDVSSQDLADATVDLDVAYEVAFIWDDEQGRFVESRTTDGLYDVVFVNVAPGPVNLLVEHPTRPTCRVPPPVLGLAGETLNLNAYCS